MPTARRGAAAVVLSNMLLVMGGMDKHCRYLAVCERFHLADAVWSSAAPMMEALWSPLVGTAAGKVFVVPCTASISAGTHLQQYEPDSHFQQAAPLPQHVHNTLGACLLGAGDKLYLLGGQHRLCEQYCPASKQWTQLLSPACATCYSLGCCAVLHAGKLLLCGGESEDNYQDMVEELDTDTQQWQTADFTLPFHYYWGNSFVGSIKL